jgi:hypothetical protein
MKEYRDTEVKYPDDVKEKALSDQRDYNWPPKTMKFKEESLFASVTLGLYFFCPFRRE